MTGKEEEDLKNAAFLGALESFAKGTVEGDPIVYTLYRNMTAIVNRLSDLAGGKDPERALASGMALAILQKEVAKASEQHFESCMARIQEFTKIQE